METDNSQETSTHDGSAGQASARLGNRLHVAGPSDVQPDTTTHIHTHTQSHIMNTPLCAPVLDISSKSPVNMSRCICFPF